jgi:outer membrane protein assembly factor BamB/plastocyanin
MRSRPRTPARGSASSTRRRWRVIALLSVIALTTAFAAACGGDSGSDTAEWMRPNADYENTRVANSEIDSENVDELNVTWTQTLTGAGPFGAFASTPLISEDGVAYVQDLASNVMAYDLETGEQLWRVEYKAPTIGPNGLAYEDGVLFGVTNGDVFALDAESGEEVWKETVLDYDFGVAEGQNLGFTIQPAVRDGVLYLSEAAKAGGGRALAFDSEAGEQLWSFDTTDEPETDDTPSGGAWNTPLVDTDGNAYYSIANGYYSPNSPKSTQNKRLYTNSLVKLDGETGELLWYYQALPNDFWDWDLHLSPVLADNDGEQLVVTGGKLGYVIAVDPDTGDEVWKTAVGIHNGHDEDSREQLDGTLALPPPPFKVFPGPYGGVETNLAVNDGKVYAAVVNLPGLVKNAEGLNRPVPEVDFTTGKGELVRLDLATGAIDWSVDLDTMPFGAITISNDLLFTTLFDGRLVAHSLEDGSEVWSSRLPTGTNSPVAIAGDRLVTAAGFPQGAGQKPALVVFQLNGERVTPPAASSADGGDADAGDSGTAAGDVIEVGVVEGALRFDPSELSADAGEVTFRFDNTEAMPHDFVITKEGERIGGTELVSNESAELTIELEPGQYTYICTPHEAAGMTGTLTVS